MSKFDGFVFTLVYFILDLMGISPKSQNGGTKLVCILAHL